MQIQWTSYIAYRCRLRGFEKEQLEDILRHSDERYFDTVTHRHVAIGRHGSALIMIPFETSGENTITPVTVHPTTRQQIAYRLRTGRFEP